MKILFVCLGNICRSPLADGLMRKKVAEKELDWTVDSCGTAAYHIGNLPDSRTRANAAEHGVDLNMLRARQFEVEDFDNFDHIYVMDQSNYNNVKAVARNPQDMDKVQLCLSVLENSDYTEVPDPYYGGEQGFETVFQLLDKATDEILANGIK